MNVNYLVKDDQNEINSHGIEQLIKQPTRFDLTFKTSTLCQVFRLLVLFRYLPETMTCGMST